MSGAWFQIKAQNLEKVLKYAHIPYILLVICKLMRIQPQTDKHLPPNPFTGKFLRTDDI
jgi:hypothetical protein